MSSIGAVRFDLVPLESKCTLHPQMRYRRQQGHTVAIRSNAGISDLIELFAARFEVSAPDEEAYRDLPAQYTIATE